MTARRRSSAVLLAFAALAFGCGAETESSRSGTIPAETATPSSAPPASAGSAGSAPEDDLPLIPGLWNELRRPPSQLTADQRATIERLEAIGYVSASRTPRGEEILTAYDSGRAFDGFNFFVSGHAAAAFLADMHGLPLHRWERAYADIWPERAAAAEHANQDFWRRAHLYENGDVLAIFSGLGIVKIDKDSNVVWARHNGAHHDLQVVPSGDIFLLTRTAHVRPDAHPTEPILEDFIAVLDPGGTEKRRVSILDCFRRSEYAELGLRRLREGGDIFHTNTMTVLADDVEYPVEWLKAGYVLTSLRSTSLLAVIDVERETVVKAWRGSFRRQHDPSIVDGGRLLLFDNTGLTTQSRVLELDPGSLEVVWEYGGDPEYPLRSWTCGAVVRLPNGHTLITDSDQGRAMEVTREGDVVWEFFNPFRIGEDPVMIATLFDVVRLPADFPLDWLPDK